MHRRLRTEHNVIVGRGSAAGNVFRLQPPLCFTDNDAIRVRDALEAVAKEQVVAQSNMSMPKVSMA